LFGKWAHSRWKLAMVAAFTKGSSTGVSRGIMGLISPDLFTGVGALAAYPMKSGSFYEE